MENEVNWIWVLIPAAICWLATLVILVMLLLKQRDCVKELVDLKVALTEAFRRLDKPMGDALAESRRNNRLLSELLALKQAEMTGEYEIVEEPIATAAEPPKMKLPQPGKAGGAKLEPPPQSFPKI